MPPKMYLGWNTTPLRLRGDIYVEEIFPLCRGRNISYNHRKHSLPRITQLPDDSKPTLRGEPLDKPQMYHVETPPDSPRTEGCGILMIKESGLSPFLNKMSLKRPREGDEEEIERRQVRVRGLVFDSQNKQGLKAGSRGAERKKGRIGKGKKWVPKVGCSDGMPMIVEAGEMKSSELNTGSGGCPNTDTGDQ